MFILGRLFWMVWELGLCSGWGGTIVLFGSFFEDNRATLLSIEHFS